MPTDETIKLTKQYINGEIELEDLQRQVVSKYRKN